MNNPIKFNKKNVLKMTFIASSIIVLFLSMSINPGLAWVCFSAGAVFCMYSKL